MHFYRLETKRLLKLAIPVLIASVAQTAMSFIDTVMAGSVSATDMAAVSVASSIWMPAILFGIGVLLAMVPIVAQLNGSGQKEKIPFQVQHSFLLALLLSVPVILVLYNAGVLIDYMALESVLSEKTIGYLHAVLYAVPALFLFQALRSFSEGLSLTVPGMVIGFIGLLANIPLNWVFVYGKFGAPALGGVGCGVATAIVYWLMFFAMLIYVLVNKKLNRIRLFNTLYQPEMSTVTRQFKLGFPIAAALFFEVSLFAAIALLIAPLGSIVVAAHQIAINFSSLVFMLPMSLSAATSIRVGHQLGEKNFDGARISSHCGIWLGVAVSLTTAVLTVIFREPIGLLYTDNPEVVSLAAQLLFLAAVYQCSDAIQVVAAGALRGYKDMQAIFVRTFIAYWIFGLPTGYTLGMTHLVTEPMGPHGFWIGNVVGLTAAAIMLTTRLLWLQRQDHDFQLALSVR
ncbi:MATE family efflux transporter [Photobacterium sp. R1]